MTDDQKKLSKLLENDITLSLDDIIKQFGGESSIINCQQLDKTRSELVHKIGQKETILKFIRCLDRRHQTNNWLPIHILRESLKKFLPLESHISRERQDEILMELTNTDQVLEFGYLKKAQYEQYVIEQGIKLGPSKIIYFIRQKVITAAILEASSKLVVRPKSSDMFSGNLTSYAAFGIF